MLLIVPAGVVQTGSCAKIDRYCSGCFGDSTRFLISIDWKFWIKESRDDPDLLSEFLELSLIFDNSKLSTF